MRVTPWRLVSLVLLASLGLCERPVTGSSKETDDSADDGLDSFDNAKVDVDVAGSVPPVHTAAGKQGARVRFPQLRAQDFTLELLVIALLVAYAFQWHRGRAENESVALEWARAYCGEGMLLERNFSLLGPGYGKNGDEMLMKNTNRVFQLWASGRRNCEGVLVTLELAPRHDLFAMALQILEAQSEVVTFDFRMPADRMPPLALAIGTASQLRKLVREQPDLKEFARILDSEAVRGVLREWPEELLVATEGVTTFEALIGGPIHDLVFSSQAFQSAHVKPYFRWLHITSDFTDTQASGSVPTSRLRLSLKIPPRGSMGDLHRLTDVALKLVDAVLAFEMPPRARERARKARAESRAVQERQAAKSAGGASAADAALRQRREAKKEAERERLKRMAPHEREKYEARQRRVEEQRLLKKRTVTMR